MFYFKSSLILLTGISLLVSSIINYEGTTCPPQDTNYKIYVGTATGEESEGIYSVRFSGNDGSFHNAQKQAKILNPSFLSLEPDKGILYCVNNQKRQSEGFVSAFKINRINLSLQLINEQPSGGKGPCYVSLIPSGKSVLVANYGSGSIGLFPLMENGALQPASAIIQHQGNGPNVERQEGPHAHYIRLGPGGLVYAADLGTDKVMVYELNEQNGQLSPYASSLELSPGAGPRHVDYHSNGKFIYVLNELAGSVSVFEFIEKQKKFVPIQTITTLPEDFSGNNKSADIHLHPNGKWLYASNRGDHNSIAVFAVDPKTGMLTLIEIQREGINWPRNFAIDPAGKFLLVANRNDDAIASFHIDQKTGELSPTGHKTSIPQPMCIQFVN